MIEHVRDQNWTAVALDFIIVVGGVFVGLQAQEWSERRDAAARARSLEARLAADFEGLVERIASGVDRSDAYASAGREVYVILKSDDPPPELEAFGALLNAAGSGHPAAGGSPTYAEMLSTGGLELLEDTELRAALVEYDVIANQADKVFDLLLPRILSSIEDVDPYIERTEPDEETGFPTVVTYDLDALRANAHRFQAQARANRNLHQVYAYQLELAEDVLAKLNGAEEN